MFKYAALALAVLTIVRWPHIKKQFAESYRVGYSQVAGAAAKPKKDPEKVRIKGVDY